MFIHLCYARSNGHFGHSSRNLLPGDAIQRERCSAVNGHHHRIQCVEEINEERGVGVDRILQAMLT
jgi:hypothetical protein